MPFRSHEQEFAAQMFALDFFLKMKGKQQRCFIPSPREDALLARYYHTYELSACSACLPGYPISTRL